MPRLIGKEFFGVFYAKAEHFANEWAGDVEGYAVVVEDFGDEPKQDNDQHGHFWVMDHSDAVPYVETHNAEIQYHADRRSPKDRPTDPPASGGRPAKEREAPDSK